jgi:protein-L-isoaspartate(D-aspartate) O-methyltransferase
MMCPAVSPALPQRTARQAAHRPRSFGPPSAGAVTLTTALLLGLAQNAYADRYATQRAGMVQLILQDVIDTSRYIGKERLDPAVMSVMGRVPRHEFVPEPERARAYANQPLPIGHGQTISQPYIVALMTDLLELNTTDQVLEVGTGSGYQAAVLAELTRAVYTIEIIEPLGQAATARLARLGYANIHGRVGDGYYGWKKQAPFDAIIVTAAASHVPPPLLKQLRPGGKMIIPVGSRFMVQDLLLIQKSPAGEFAVRQILPVRFVPLTGEH